MHIPKYPDENILKNRLRKELPRRLLYCARVTLHLYHNLKEKKAKTHRTMCYQSTAADNVLQVAHQTQIEEYYWINTLLSAFTVISFGKFIEKIKI